MPGLFDPIRLGAIAAPNRIIMAPLTRGRATREHVPTPLMAEYYAQRAGAGLIISEATGISQQGLGWPYAPGLWNAEQVAAWRPVTAAVHQAGGRIAAQLWHMGQLVHPDFLGGQQPVAASATTAPDAAHTYDGKKPYHQARALRLDEIPALLDDYRRAARHARIVERIRQYPGQERQVREFYQKTPGARAELRAPIFQEKTIAHILSQVKVTEAETSKEALFADDEDGKAATAEAAV